MPIPTCDIKPTLGLNARLEIRTSAGVRAGGVSAEAGNVARAGMPGKPRPQRSPGDGKG